MTKILKLVLRGFKSFANKTELVFGDKFNVVLGPNGSGKSNVLDAICFVLGKSSSRELRAEKSANLIYNGGKSKTPAKEGEVSIYFDNSDKTFPTDDPVVKVSRIVKHGGNSVYKINDQTRTRQQILELLGVARINPDGYNIILQGDIVRFVEMSGNERRSIIEEIAGISVYEEKKHKAMNELGKVDERLKESEIILGERDTYLKELKSERDQAIKFRDLQNKVKVSKASFLSKKIKSHKDKIEKYEKDIAATQSKNTELNNEIEKLKDDVAKKEDELAAIKDKIETSGEEEQIKLHKEVEELRVSIATGKQRISSIEKEIEKIAERKTQLDSNLKELQAKIDSLEEQKKKALDSVKSKNAEILTFNNKIDEFKKKNKIDDIGSIDTDMENIDKEADVKEKEINSLRVEQQNLLREKDRIEYKLQTLDETIDKVKEVSAQNKDEMSKLKNKKDELKKAVKELDVIIKEDSDLAARIGSTRGKLSRIKEELAKLQARTIGMREAAATDIATKKIVENKRKFGGVHGTVTDLGTVQSKYSTALEVAAGSRIRGLVVETDKVAANCIQYLKTNKLGTATFMPLNKLKDVQITAEAKKLSKEKGVLGLAVDLVSFDSKFSKVFRYVFGNTLVVEDVETARKIGIGKMRMVTLEGDLVELSGVMQGGFRQKSKGRGFKQGDVDTDLDKLSAEESDLENSLRSYESRREELEEKINRLREFKATLEGDIIKSERSLHLDDDDLDATQTQKKDLTTNLANIEKDLAKIEDKISQMNSELAQLKVKKQELRSKISQLRNPTMVAELNTFEEKKSTLKEEVSELNAEEKSISAQLRDVLIPELENIQKILKQHDKEEKDFKEEISTLKKTIKTQESELKDKEKESDKFRKQYKEMFNQRTKLSDDIQKTENKIILKEEQIRRMEQKDSYITVEYTKQKTELAELEEEFKAFEDVQLIQNKSEEDLHVEVKEAERAIDRMGAVNMKALEIYDKVKEEYDNLVAKREKLLEEKEDVLSMMNEIESRKKELFMKTLEVIDGQFQRTFTALSTKGEAFLELEDPDSPFEGGLYIKVRLTGQKFMDIRGLSGGEKTMTALAFIFSIQEHDPASFYVLDEVDAALDKRNSEKLANLVRQYSEHAQYVVISHNDGVITQADNLYGVSMDHHGITKVVSLKI